MKVMSVWYASTLRSSGGLFCCPLRRLQTRRCPWPYTAERLGRCRSLVVSGTNTEDPCGGCCRNDHKEVRSWGSSEKRKSFRPSKKSIYHDHLVASMASYTLRLRSALSPSYICLRCSARRSTPSNTRRWLHSTPSRRQEAQSSPSPRAQQSMLETLEERGFVNQIAG